ncbi:MAG: 3'(2'),5'-bisphosphate nucleotidase CysQ [Nodosilinea sp.]
MVPLNQSDQVAVQQLLIACGDYAYEQSKQPFQVFEKGAEDYVTTVDRALDQRLLAGFQALFPHDGIITEEDRSTFRQFTHACPRQWFIDPIDGTDDFINGRANYSVMVGQVVGGVPRAGWVYAPAHRQLYWGGPGWGLFQRRRNDPPQSLIPKEPMFKPGQGWSMVIGDKDRRRFGAAITEGLPGVNFLSLGSFGLKVLAVMQGQAGLYLYLNGRVKLWDTTGPLALAQAAGLTCCDLNGNPIQFVEPYIDPETLVHRQPILVGWSSYVNALRSPLRRVVADVMGSRSSI